MVMIPQVRVVTPVSWLFAPEWLRVEEACHLSGHDRETMLWMVADGAVDTDLDGLICKRSLYEFQEALALVLHWAD